MYAMIQGFVGLENLHRHNTEPREIVASKMNFGDDAILNESRSAETNSKKYIKGYHQTIQISLGPFH